MPLKKEATDSIPKLKKEKRARLSLPAIVFWESSLQTDTKMEIDINRYDSKIPTWEKKKIKLPVSN